MGIFAPFSYLEQRVIVPGFDPDAQAFITAAGITDSTQQNAIDGLVVDLKAAGIWNNLLVCYPFVGGTATTHKYNLIDPQDTNAAHRLTFFNSPTHNSNGVEFDGVSEYATTYFDPSTDFSVGGLNDNHVFVSYFHIEANDDGTDWGIQNTAGGNFFQGGVRTSLNTAYGRNMSSTFSEISNASIVPVYGQNRNSSTEYDINLAKTKTAVSSTSSKLPPLDVYLAARNQNTAAGGFNNRGFNMFAIGAGLSDTEWDAWVDANNTFQSALGRWDIDAAAFINAAGITDSTQQSALTTLVSDLKANGLWTKLFAIYPFVGGTATTHKYNLKNPADTDAAFRLDFNGTITHSSNGIQGDGSSGYYDTHIDWSYSGWSVNSASAFVYIRNNVAETKVDLGILNTASPYCGFQLLSRDASDVFQCRINSGGTVISTSNTDSRGGFAISRTGSTTASISKNTTQTNSTEASVTQKTGNIYGLCFNINGSANFFTTRQQAFSAFGEGLTDTELDNLYTIVQTFQTTLGRNV